MKLEKQLKFIECGGPGSGRHPGSGNNVEDLSKGHFAYERKAAGAVLNHPNLQHFIDVKSKSIAVAGPHGVWQTQPTKNSAMRANRLRDKAIALGYTPSKSDRNHLKHEDGSAVRLVQRMGGHGGLQVEFHNRPKK